MLRPSVVAAALAAAAALVPPAAFAATFTGLVQDRAADTVTVFDPTSRRSLTFVAPPGFHAVSSTDGVVRGATLARVPLRMQVRVDYHVQRNRPTLDGVAMLTLGACQTLLDEPVPHPRGTFCPN